MPATAITVTRCLACGEYRGTCPVPSVFDRQLRPSQRQETVTSSGSRPALLLGSLMVAWATFALLSER